MARNTRSAADECWIADIPDLRYCSAHGPTPQKALKEVMVAKELWLEVAREYVWCPNIRSGHHCMVPGQ